MKKIRIIALSLMAFSAMVDTARTALADNPTTPPTVVGKRK